MKKWVPVFLTAGLLWALAVPAPAAGTTGTGLTGVGRLEPVTGASPVPHETAPAPIAPVSPIEKLPPASPSDGRAEAEQGPARQPGQGTVRDIARYWEENGYPAYVSYACETGGETIGEMACSWWEIGLTADGGEERQEVLELCSPFCLVAFKSTRYSYRERAEAYSRLIRLAGEDENIREVIFSRRDDRVWAVVPEELVEHYADCLARDCGLGEVVRVTDEDSAAGLEAGPAPAAPEAGAEEGSGGGADSGPDLLARARLFLPFAGVAALSLAALTVSGKLRLPKLPGRGRKGKGEHTRNKTIDE